MGWGPKVEDHENGKRPAGAQREFGAGLHVQLQKAGNHRADAPAGQRQHNAQDLELRLGEGRISEGEPQHRSDRHASEQESERPLQPANPLDRTSAHSVFP